MSGFPAPYTGNAPEPPGAAFEAPDGTPMGGGEVVVQAEYNPVTHETVLTPQPMAPQIVSAPPPANPAEASQFAEMNRRMGEITNALGELRQENARLRVEREIQAATTHQYAAPPVPALPPGIDPDAVPNFAQLNNILHAQAVAHQAYTEAQVIRARLGITRDEEAAIAAQYPNLPAQEPARSQALQRIIPLLRPTPSPVTAATTAPAITRPVHGTVPVSEAPTPSIGSAQPIDPAAAAQAAFARAEQIKDPQERIDAMRKANEQWEAAMKLTPENMKYVPFRQNV